MRIDLRREIAYTQVRAADIEGAMPTARVDAFLSIGYELLFMRKDTRASAARPLSFRAQLS